ncbi:putative nuclease HARBI1 [Prorops nasuta]|uniref:putative nuclease HARBI1 n=1 Tax=Prorops nasuta TaxID=863751 RepID=UPI0034CE77CD
MDYMNIWNILFEDDDEEDDLLILYSSNRETHKRIENYIPQVLLNYSLSDFKSHFRLSKATFEALLEKIGSCLLQTPDGPKIMPFKQLAITLWVLGNQEVYRSVSDRFNMAKSTIWKCVFNVAHVLQNHRAEYIKWPEEHQLMQNVNKFAEISNFPGVVGAVDGCHIQISAPTENPNSYINRKGFHSIVLQGICDPHRKFIDVFIGYCGSVHDARIWQLSKIKHAIDSNPQRYFPENTHLLGDSAYPISKTLLVPYRDNGHLSDIQTNYNRKLSANRMVIKRSFGLLKARFRKLKYVYMYDTDMIPLIILTCCILHNICIDNEEEQFHLTANEEDHFNVEVDNEATAFSDGEEKRDIIAHLLNTLNTE